MSKLNLTKLLIISVLRLEIVVKHDCHFDPLDYRMDGFRLDDLSHL